MAPQTPHHDVPSSTALDSLAQALYSLQQKQWLIAELVPLRHPAFWPIHPNNHQFCDAIHDGYYDDESVVRTA